MNGAALADDATATFTLNSNLINATNVIIVNVASVGTPGAYQVTVGAVATGSCSISVLNVSGGPLSQAIKLNFAVITAVKT
jgi:Ni,Fe-hydrogenase maturation factor